MNTIVKRLVDSYAILILAGRITIEEVSKTYTLAGTTYQLKELVEIEVAERTIEVMD